LTDNCSRIRFLRQDHFHGEREITKNMFYYKREVTFVSKWFAVNDLFKDSLVY